MICKSVDLNVHHNLQKNIQEEVIAEGQRGRTRSGGCKMGKGHGWKEMMKRPIVMNEYVIYSAGQVSY